MTCLSPSAVLIINTSLGTLLARLDADLFSIANGLGLLLGGVLQVVRDLLESLTNALSGRKSHNSLITVS